MTNAEPSQRRAAVTTARRLVKVWYRTTDAGRQAIADDMSKFPPVYGVFIAAKMADLMDMGARADFIQALWKGLP